MSFNFFFISYQDFLTTFLQVMTDEALDKVLSYTVFFIFSKPKRNMNKIGPFLLTVCDLDSIRNFKI